MSKKSDILNYCSSWYQTLSGQSSLNKLDNVCADILSEVFGYYAVEMGVLSKQHSLLRHSRIAAGFTLIDKANSINDIEPVGSLSKINNNSASLIATTEQLPLATDNIDLVIATHTLESSKDPHQVLREIDRILVPEGHCILIGFNPFALSQLGKLIRSGFNRKKKPFKTRSVTRVRDWFSLLGFEVVDVHYMGVRPGISNKKLFEGLGWLERAGEYAGPLLGKLYVIHVKKQVMAMHPNKKVWRAPAVLSGGKVVLNNTAQKIRRENYSNL